MPHDLKTTSETAVTAAAFSHKASVYDAFGEDHPNLARMRARVRRRIEALVPPGGRLLELNAGTGLDAAHFASLGYNVLATDIAPGMLAEIRAKIDRLALSDRLHVRGLSFTELDSLEEGPFDLVFSNMGGLNCTPDLAIVAGSLPRLLVPGGHAVAVIMPRVCPWEWTALLKGDWRTAVRRFRPGGTVANVEGHPVPTYYFSARKVEAAFGTSFRRRSLENLSLFTPPADHKSFARRHPGLYRRLAELDDRLAGAPLLRGWGDFFILTMQLRS